MRNNKLQLRREEKIKADYKEMNDKKCYTQKYIVEQLVLTYDLSGRTIQAIVWGEYDRRRQENKETDSISTNEKG